MGDDVLTFTPPTSQACAMRPGDEVRCFALVRTDIAAHLGVGGNVAGYGPTDLISAYKLPSSTKGSGQIVGIVDAQDDPNAEADLAVYRSNFGLTACTTANGCFKKVNQTGGTNYPAPDPGWSEEISLDLDMVSASCPKCHIVLVEATSPTFSNLGTAVNEAVKLGADEVSNSYGGSEFAKSSPAFTHKGVVITASSGDSGYSAGPQQPCSFATVVCVGGTTLLKSSKPRGWAETAWSGAGSGCSALVKKPTWQKDTGCKMRTESDVSADANPGTGVAVYDTYGVGGWLVFGGTSVSSPLTAGVYALAGNGATQDAAKGLYANLGKTTLYDVIGGANGTCSPTYLCTAVKGYDGPTGVGTPQGVGAY